MKNVEFISSQTLEKYFDKEEELGRDLLVTLGHHDIDGKYYSVYEEKATGKKLACPAIRTVHMGFNSNEDGKLEELVEIVERDGVCYASWGVTGRTMHQILAFQLKDLLPQYKFDIGYNYHCLVQKN